jgi:ribose transport system permease protein
MGDSGVNVVSVILLALVVSTAAGLFNGVAVAYGRLQAIVATLATSFIWYGVALVTMRTPGGHVAPVLVSVLTGTPGGWLPIAVLWLIGLLIAAWLFRKTRVSVNIYAIGSHGKSAHLAGIRTSNTQLWAYALAGFSYGVAGVFLSAVMGSGDANVGSSYLLPAIAAVCIGGTPLTGGRGTLASGVIGAAILTVLTGFLFVLGVSSFYTDIFTGVFIILAVVLGGFSRLAGSVRHALSVHRADSAARK